MQTNNFDKNRPCPCGSGLKYKKCCMLNPDADLDDIIDHRIDKSLAIDFGEPAVDLRLFEKYYVDEYCAQSILYSMLANNELEELLVKTAQKKIKFDKEEAKIIKKARNAGELMEIMLRGFDPIHNILFIKCALRYEDSFIPLLFEELKRQEDDIFIELSLKLIRRSSGNWSKEISDLIKTHFSLAYHISVTCILLGFYPDRANEKLLWDYYNFFSIEFPYQNYWTGPYLGLYQFKTSEQERFYEKFKPRT